MKPKQAEEWVQKVIQEIRQAIATLVKTKWLVKGKGKKNVNFTLKQAMKAQRGSRGIALLFL